jgi:hypothetical protein
MDRLNNTGKYVGDERATLPSRHVTDSARLDKHRKIAFNRKWPKTSFRAFLVQGIPYGCMASQCGTLAAFALSGSLAGVFCLNDW